MTLRQLWVRIKALPAESPLMVALDHDRADADAKAEYDSIDETLAMLKRG